MEALNEKIQNTLNEYSQYQTRPSKAGGTRFRKALMNLSKACNLARKDVLANVKEMPVKKRVKNETPSSEEPSSEELSEEVVESPKPKRKSKAKA